MPTTRYALTNDQWERIAPLLPPPGLGGRPPADPRRMVDAAFWILHSGSPWRDLPDRFGPWQTVYDRYSGMRASGLLDRVVARLQLRLNEAGLIDRDLFCIDGTNVRAARAAGGAAKKKSAAR